MDKFIQELKSNDFKIVRQGTNPENIPVRTGDLATKGNSILNINEQLMVINIIGETPYNITQIFNEIIPICSSCGLDISNTSKYFEFFSRITAEPTKKPSNAISKFMKNDQCNKINEIFNIDSTISGFKLSSKDYNPNSTDFFEMKIEPLVKNLDAYFINCMYRDKKREKIEHIMENFEEKISKFIDVMENA